MYAWSRTFGVYHKRQALYLFLVFHIFLEFACYLVRPQSFISKKENWCRCCFISHHLLFLLCSSLYEDHRIYPRQERCASDSRKYTPPVAVSIIATPLIRADYMDGRIIESRIAPSTSVIRVPSILLGLAGYDSTNGRSSRHWSKTRTRKCLLFNEAYADLSFLETPSSTFR